MTALLLCTDLDRTLIPNGEAAESPGAREALARLVASDAVTLVYVTGRDVGRLEEALERWSLPTPDIAVTDVGTRILERTGAGWREWDAWADAIGADWAGRDHATLREALADLRELCLQAADRQGPHKLSFDVAAGVDLEPLRSAAQTRLAALGVKASVVTSVDDLTGGGLLDVLPASATKVHAVEFVRERLGVTREHTLYAGDSGNDLDALVSALPAVLVANARDDVRATAVARARAAGLAHRLYVARGGTLGMNGCYAAGILEGVEHFRPELMPLLAPGTSS